jgi:hypothetical protein
VQVVVRDTDSEFVYRLGQIISASELREERSPFSF